MEEKNVDLLAQYDLNIYRTSRVKGACLLETEQGLKIFGNCNLSEGKAEFEQKIKLFLLESGFEYTDRYVRTKEGNILVQGPYNEIFAMRDWYNGEECNVRRSEQVCGALQSLAKLHQCLDHVDISESELAFCQQPNLLEVLDRRNKELRRVRTYIFDKKQKGSFESLFLSHFPQAYEQAVQANAELKASNYLEYSKVIIQEKRMYHGNFTHHSVLILPEGKTAIISFEKAGIGIQIQDFYLFFRKLMEKHEWDISLGYEMINSYEKVRTIPEEELKLLGILLLYPEKFWKITNQYYNNRKSWIPQKNMQKLTMTMDQAQRKNNCLRELFPKL